MTSMNSKKLSNLNKRHDGEPHLKGEIWKTTASITCFITINPREMGLESETRMVQGLTQEKKHENKMHCRFSSLSRSSTEMMQSIKRTMPEKEKIP